MEELINKWKKLLELRLSKTEEIKHDNCIVATEDLQTAINLIEKQQEQLQEKDKVIDAMAEKIYKEDSVWYSKQQVIECFTKKAREV